MTATIQYAGDTLKQSNSADSTTPYVFAGFVYVADLRDVCDDMYFTPEMIREREEDSASADPTRFRSWEDIVRDLQSPGS